MNRVKRIEAQGILSELKAFAFEGNEDFKNGALPAVEVQKTFHLPPPPEFRGSGNYPLRKCVLSFQASRMGEKIRNHPAYVYDLAVTAERTIGFIPFTIFDELDDDEQTALEIVEEGSLSESYVTSFSTSNHEVGNIEVIHSYLLAHRGNTFFDINNMEVVNTYDGDMEVVPANEMDDKSGSLYVADEILAEQMPSQFDRLMNDLAFRAIVDPFRASPELGVSTFRESVAQMRVIMDGLRNGLNVKNLYDLNPPGLTIKQKEEIG